MKQEQIKTLLVNIATGAVILGILTAIYFVATKDKVATTVVPGIVNTTNDVVEAARMGAEVRRTVAELERLERTVASSAIIFSASEFKNLVDFSVTIPEDNNRRPNPFVLTEWKAKLKSIEGNASSRQTQTASVSGASTAGETVNNVVSAPKKVVASPKVTVPPKAPTPPNLLGDFGVDTSLAL